MMSIQTSVFSLSLWSAALFVWPSPLAQTPPERPRTGVEALAAIVGTWQSDVVDGRSALSNCVWTPQHAAVLCEQTITSQAGVRHALNLFTRCQRADQRQ
jgi:hypothetical protein